MTIDILCKVVDNFGDIGVVYRLAKALSELAPGAKAGPAEGLELRILIDDLASFRSICPEVAVGPVVQTVRGWTIVSAEGGPEARSLFRAERPRTVIECFACGRPDWYEEILFDEGDTERRLIVDLEYLTAEDWAADFHRLPSATRSALVKKALFMPGFEGGTGGLIHGESFLSLRSAYLEDDERPALRRALLERIGAAFPPANARRSGVVPETALGPTPDSFWVVVFSYERDYAPIVEGLTALAAERPLCVLAAAGKSAGPLRSAWEDAGRPFPLVELPFLSQELWDETLLASDFLIVRGEDSLSRAALSGRPFLWHAYPLPDGAQEAKVRALLGRLETAVDPEDFDHLKSSWLSFNAAAAPGGTYGRSSPAAPDRGGPALAELLRRCGTGESIDRSFRSWSEKLLEIGDLGRNLLTFLGDF